MTLQVRIIQTGAIEMAGIRKTFRAGQIAPREVWQKFMPLLKDLENLRSDANLYALQQYGYRPELSGFDPDSEITFWAAVPIHTSTRQLSLPLHRLTVTPGTYAVCLHKGKASEFQKTMQSFLSEWLPQSGYVLSDRLHFQVMTPEYKGPDDPDSKEEVWIPIDLDS